MSEEFKCPSCGGTASIAYHRSGDNLLYCQDCQKTFSERYAKIREQAARIAELEADVNRVKAESDIAWRSESKMTAECVRLRKALKEIAKLADSEYGKRIPAPSCVEFLTIKQYAKKALEGVENE